MAVPLGISRSLARRGDGSIWTGSGIPPSAALYDLYATDTQSRGVIPFTVTWPTAPQGTLTPLTVTNSSELTTAIQTANAQITVAAGSYGALTLQSNDQHWIINDNASFTSLGTSGTPQRIILDGGSVTQASGSVTLILHDLLMRNMNINIPNNGSFALGLNAFGGTPRQAANRIAIIQNTIYATRTGFFTPQSTAGDPKSEDLIIAGNYISGGMTIGNSGVESGIRVMSVDRTIIVDNRVRCGFDGQGVKHTFRSHYGNTNFYMRRNMTEYGDGIFFRATAGSTLEPGVHEMGNHWVYDYDFYSTNNSAYAFRQYDSGYWPGALVTDNTNGYMDSPLNTWLWSAQGIDSIGSQSDNPYQSPPALGAWLTANGLPPGADH